jgi:hypothetical protein
MPTSFYFIEVALYADDRAIITMPHQPKLLTGFLQTSVSMQA